ncbi:lipoprotein nlpD [Yersinia pestis PY-15]|nr:lipoprotein nlpD [Yersinia pestis PY-15]
MVKRSIASLLPKGAIKGLISPVLVGNLFSPQQVAGLCMLGTHCVVTVI